MKYLILILLSVAPGWTSSECSDVIIKADGDVANYQKCAKVKSLEITGDASKVALDSITSVEKSIIVSATSGLGSISMKKLQSAKDLEINNNSGLTSVKFPSLSKLSGYLFVSGNSPKLSFAAPKLSSVSGNVTFSNCTGIDVSGLSNVGNMVSFSGNSANKIALPNLKSITQGLSFSSNDQISSLSLNKLDKVNGALLVANNTKLGSVSFPNLQSVSGALDLSGKFSNVSFPSLTEVKGGANIKSDSESLKCDDLENLQAVVLGSFECADGAKTTKRKSTKSDDSGDDGDAESFSFTNSPSSWLMSTVLLAFFYKSL